MTSHTVSAPVSAPPTAPRTSGFRAAVRAVAILACLPYVTLKIAWIAGSRIGIPDGSSLLDHPTTMAVANGITVLMDAAVVALALLLTQPWGMRVRAWLLALPVWVATGLLAPIIAGFPLQLLVRAFGGSTISSGERSAPFLDEWVFGMVYGGFIVQGLALGVLFVGYARRRWGHLGQGAVRDLPANLPTAPAQRVAATAAALLTLVPATLHALWAGGSTAGLSRFGIDQRTSDSYALEWMHAGFAAATAVGVLMIAFRRGGSVPLKVPLALAWVGSGALACWGGWLSLASLTTVDDLTGQPSALLQLTYAVQMIVGMLVVTIGAYFFAERSAAAARREA
ncbi:hypothetical protein RCO28_04455 [Streptomyces sp. LHD-70]|uniref:hypothetical protein n=1 Tax=Streptomyces sp. LHD-70 TaxID=3072140 RepID=UPI0028102381|nr:hypothetical protein [Streptomyces sp. LHD-70]MDQ8701745.1 hypothetical protein [Streptomyces sp. LHD-70]